MARVDRDHGRQQLKSVVGRDVSVTERIASLACRKALGDVFDSPRPLPPGRTSSAWATRTEHGRWVVRIPIENSGRTSSYASEQLIGHLLREQGAPVAEWTLTTVDGVQCSVAPMLPGQPIAYGLDWPAEFAESLAIALGAIHALPASGFGPLENTTARLVGRSPTWRAGIVDRWHHAPIWPFDGSGLADHPVSGIAPELTPRIAVLANRVDDAASGFTGLVHSDLHCEHLLIDPHWRLGGVLDFGDAFVGSQAWDFALLGWHYGDTNAGMVATLSPNGPELHRRGRILAIAVGLYKLAKNPRDSAVLPRLKRILDEAEC